MLGPDCVLSAALPAVRNRQTNNHSRDQAGDKPDTLGQVSRRGGQSLSFHRRTNHTALLSGEPFALEWDDGLVKKDGATAAGLLQELRRSLGSKGMLGASSAIISALMSWLYFSPFFCDLRSLALLQDSDVIRYPTFAIVFGKSNCGKTSLGRYFDDVHVRLCAHAGEAEFYHGSAAGVTARLQALPRRVR